MLSWGVTRAAACVALMLLAGSCGGDAAPSGEAVVEPASTDTVETTVESTGTSSTDGSETTETTLEPPPPGSLRTPLDSERGTAIPTSFWAIDGDTFDLVRVDSGSGAVLETLGGWGAEAGQSDQAPQLLTSVEVAPGGRLWLDDCCEPAFGTVYVVDDDQTFDLRAGANDIERRTGLSPEVSPDGALVAVSVGDTGVAISRTSNGASVVEGSAVNAVVAEAIGRDPATPLFPYPLAWLSATVVVVVVADADGDILQAVDVSAAQPRTVGPTIATDTHIIAGDVRTDGHLVVASTPVDADGSDSSVAGAVYDPDTGDVIAAFDLPPGTIAVDYDTTGTYLLTVDVDGAVTWLGRGQTGRLASGYIAGSW